MYMKAIDLSIIIPVYNVEAYLSRCIDSLLDQGLQSYEMILVDDGSTDRSSIICDGYAKKYINIHVIHKENAGLGMARNSGIDIAEGKYLAFVDPDDFLDSGYLDRLFRLAIQQDVEVCMAGQVLLDKDGIISPIDCVDPDMWNIKITDIDQIKKISAKVISADENGKDFCLGSSCFSIYKCDIFTDKKLRFMSERTFISEDMAFCMELYQVCGSVYFSDIAGYHYWYNENSLSRGYREDRFRLLIKTIRQVERWLEDHRIYGEGYRVALYFWVNYEKCINQEVRYKKDTATNTIKQNMIKMVNDPIAQKYLGLLVKTERLEWRHQILCSLLYREHIDLLIVLLKLYNKIKH